MPVVLSTLRLGQIRTKKEENQKKEVQHSHSHRNVVLPLKSSQQITVEMKENHNPSRPVPNARNLPKKNVLVLNDDVKVLLPPSAVTTQDSDNEIQESQPEKVSTNPVTELHRTSSVLSVNAPEFTPGSKIHCGKSSHGSSPSDSLTSSSESEESSTSTLRTAMTLPCISIDNKLRQYVFRIDKAGDLMPDLNLSVPPPRVIAHSSFHGPSIIIPLRCNFKIASGSLIVDQFHPLRRQFQGPGNCESPQKKMLINASVTAHPSDFLTSDSKCCCDVSCQTGESEESVEEILESPVNEKLEVAAQPLQRKRYTREDLIELMDEEFSIVAPHLSESVHKLLSNSNSSNFLADTVSRDEGLIQKSSSTSAFEQSSQGPILLMKSISLENPTRDSFFGAGDGRNQIGKGEQALRTFRSCLNKLTADNFEAVLAEVKQMRVGSDSTILSFIELLYEKAILEPTYATHYVQLTMALKNIFTIGPGKKSFEHFAIVACQRGFEEAMKKLHNLNQMDDEAKDKLRHGLSGSIQFIAKMYLNRILTRRIIMEICGDLLKLECPESIEPLCKLLEISGEKLEKDAPKDEKLNAVMRKLGSISSKFPTRIKFMIQNLIEQRKDGWKPRFGKDGPKKLDQVANECGFVKRLGTVGRYDEVEVKPDFQQHRFDNYNRGDHFGVRGNRDGFQGNRGRSFRGGGQHRRGGKSFVNNKK